MTPPAPRLLVYDLPRGAIVSAHIAEWSVADITVVADRGAGIVTVADGTARTVLHDLDSGAARGALKRAIARLEAGEPYRWSSHRRHLAVAAVPENGQVVITIRTVLVTLSSEEARGLWHVLHDAKFFSAGCQTSHLIGSVLSVPVQRRYDDLLTNPGRVPEDVEETHGQ
ncbi:hypothetical protein [Amycolatopsis sp. CA-230715]|uniref:hypothetical protein n=1 Tax=Amycolatopsis sp. CA-230715 TaxID=2745196 RepID=UPI001C00BD8D|nr:hypothetical protein [Amycolatopsis sp. CA-230715]QWF85884.1 hypothetical protein HUW46_09364 [Amycolatopsis sp. CA-230715]